MVSGSSGYSPTAHSAETAEYQWTERRFWTDSRTPTGMCWSLREMCSYTTDVESFTAHLQAMAEGLERADFTEWDSEAIDGEGYGIFVRGLRPMTPEDKTYDDMERERKEEDERAMLAYLKEKYEPPPPSLFDEKAS